MRNDIRLPKRTIQDVEVLSSEMRDEIREVSDRVSRWGPREIELHQLLRE
jgi:hypothetical protein